MTASTTKKEKTKIERIQEIILDWEVDSYDDGSAMEKIRRILQT